MFLEQKFVKSESKSCTRSITNLIYLFFLLPFSAGTYLPQLTALASLFLHVAPLAGKQKLPNKICEID